MQQQPKFSFNFYRFIGPDGNRTTEFVRDYSLADGMRGLVDRNPEHIKIANQRVNDWAATKNVTVNPQEPFPSEKHPGKVWLEFRFSGLTL
jgi:hypothetical protein